SLVHPRAVVLHRGVCRPHGSSAILARLGHAAYRWHGPVVHPVADGVLRGQWRAPAALEGTSPVRVLAVARRDRVPADRSGAVATRSSTATERATARALTLRSDEDETWTRAPEMRVRRPADFT